MRTLCCGATAFIAMSASASATNCFFSTDPLDALDGGPGGSVGSESDGAGPPASLGSASGPMSGPVSPRLGGYRYGWLRPAWRPRRMALRSSSSSRGRPRRYMS